jgi:biopolymer transport protein ExbD
MKPLLEDESHEELDDRTDLVPLIDCVFLVLLFYVVAATFAEDSVFPVQLPKAESNQQVTTVERADTILTIWISSEGEFAVNKQPVTMLDLGRMLREKVDATAKPTVVIRGDRQAPYEKVALAMGIVQSLGVADLSMVVDRSGTR